MIPDPHGFSDLDPLQRPQGLTHSGDFLFRDAIILLDLFDQAGKPGQTAKGLPEMAPEDFDLIKGRPDRVCLGF